MEHLPKDLVRVIARGLDAVSLCRLVVVSKRWATLLDPVQEWPWMTYLCQDFSVTWEWLVTVLSEKTSSPYSVYRLAFGFANARTMISFEPRPARTFGFNKFTIEQVMLQVKGVDDDEVFWFALASGRYHSSRCLCNLEAVGVSKQISTRLWELLQCFGAHN